MAKALRAGMQTSAKSGVGYEGTCALLERWAAMYLTNPPTHAARLRIKVWYRDADAFMSTPIRAEF